MIKSINAAWWVQRWGELHPDKPAILFEGRSISYYRLAQLVDRSACWLQSLGIEKGDRVAVLLDNCPEFIELYLACAKLGAIFVPINNRLKANELEYIIDHCRPRLLVYAARFKPLMKSLNLNQMLPPIVAAGLDFMAPLRGVNYQDGTTAYEGRKPFLTPAFGPENPEEPQVIMYTSGTTGRPKGAVLSHRKTFFNCLNADIFFHLHFDDIMLILLPLFHSGGLFIQASPCLYKGATILLHSRFDPVGVISDIALHKVTKLLGVPTVYRALLNLDSDVEKNLDSLKICAIGGEKTTPELLQQCHQAGFSCRQIMGQTETSILLWASEDESLARPGAVGRPVFHAEVKLMGKNGEPVETGQVGEIVARGSVLMKEYWRDPVATESTMRSGWLKTGDLARMDSDGFYYLVDRTKDMYISGGENVYPSEVERIIRLHAQVKDVAVTSQPDLKWGESGHAFIIVNNGVQPSEQSIFDLCDQHLANFKKPKKISFVDELPRTPLGKVRKYQLKK